MKPVPEEPGDAIASPASAAETTGAGAVPPDGAEPGEVTVFYDGACPLCTAEIGYYQRKRGSENISWVDVSACEAAEVIPDLKREDALRRFHVRTAGGQVIAGGRAFAILWSALPGFRWLGRIFRSGGPAHLIDWLYNRFLRWRPRLQALARKRASPLQRRAKRVGCAERG